MSDLHGTCSYHLDLLYVLLTLTVDRTYSRSAFLGITKVLILFAPTGCGPRYRQARMQPPTLSPEDGETKTMTVARPHHVCVPLSEWRQHRPARSTCADAFGVRSSPLGADMVGKSRNMSADMLFMPGLLALMPPTICCVRSQSVRDLVTEISGGATPAPVRCGSEL